MDYYGYGIRKGIIKYDNKSQREQPQLISSHSALLINNISTDQINHSKKEFPTDTNILLNNYQRYLNPTKDYYKAYHPPIKPIYLSNKSTQEHFNHKQNISISLLQCNSNPNKINLKNIINPNIFKPNLAIIEQNNQSLRRVKPPLHSPDFGFIKSQTFLESNETPEYLRQYDKEEWKNIDQFYKNANEERLVLSRMNNWIIKDPMTSQRNKNYFTQLNNHTGQISKGAPEWMRRRPEKVDYLPELFKKYQYSNSIREGSSISRTTLIDKDQSNALPNYLKPSYKRGNNGFLI